MLTHVIRWEKKQIPVKEAVSPLARIEDEEDEEEGMKLRRRSKIKATILSFDLPLFCTSVWLYSALIYWQFLFLVLTKKIQVVGMVNGTPSQTKAAKTRVSQYHRELCARRSSSYRAIYLSMHSSVLLPFLPSNAVKGISTCTSPVIILLTFYSKIVNRKMKQRRRKPRK